MSDSYHPNESFWQIGKRMKIDPDQETHMYGSHAFPINIHDELERQKFYKELRNAEQEKIERGQE